MVPDVSLFVNSVVLCTFVVLIVNFLREYVLQLNHDSEDSRHVGHISTYCCGIQFCLYLYKCSKGQNPKIMVLHKSIMEHHNSIYGAPLQIMQLYMHVNYALN